MIITKFNHYGARSEVAKGLVLDYYHGYVDTVQPHLLRRLVDVVRSIHTTHTHMISCMTDMLKEDFDMEIRFNSYSCTNERGYSANMYEHY